MLGSMKTGKEKNRKGILGGVQDSHKKQIKIKFKMEIKNKFSICIGGQCFVLRRCSTPKASFRKKKKKSFVVHACGGDTGEA